MNQYTVSVSINLEFNILASSAEDAEELIMNTEKPELLENCVRESLDIDNCQEISSDEASFANCNWTPV